MKQHTEKNETPEMEGKAHSPSFLKKAMKAGAKKAAKKSGK